MPNYLVVYDGCCNLCTRLVQLLEVLDQGQRFEYLPMQATETLQHWQITPELCEQGMILVNLASPDQRWQGSEAAEEISRLLPLGQPFIEAYRTFPGLKNMEDQVYAWVRDHRYELFGRRAELYTSAIAAQAPETCSGHCQGTDECGGEHQNQSQ